ncbi:MAG: hypothetical protein HY901_06165 [Deltaproteobacteria bacterium]|nr:hypothetical protein [Deltaproteobacteria bacterium]
MARLFVASFLAACLASCASAPKISRQPLTQTCAEIAKQLENGSGLQPPEKRELVESLKEQVFHWKVRVLAVSDETSRGELAKGMVFDVECQDRPGSTQEGMRYLFTLYFEQRVPELARLGRGSRLTIDGSLTSYEGEGAFAGRVLAYGIE